MNAPATRPRHLESYVAGAWVRGTGAGTPLLDAATGETVALIDASGIDFAAALAFGRDRGGPALRAMTTHQRALMLKALGQALMAGKEEFYALSTATGATRTDSWIDIEGGIGTLLSYASRGPPRAAEHHVAARRRARDALAADDSFAGQHVLRPARRRGGAHQRLQLPLLGDAGEDRADAARRHAGDRQAREPDRLPDRADGPPHRSPPASCPRARCS